MILPGLNPFTATSARQSVRNGKPFLLSPPPRVFSHLPLASQPILGLGVITLF